MTASNAQACWGSITLSEPRTAPFRRNDQLEKLLEELNLDLQPSERALMASPKIDHVMRYPIILVMGPLRSGTTLFMQWLANTGIVAYPTNLLSRFYQAPILGAKIQLLLTDPRFNFRDELGEFAQPAEFRSENGKTKGVLAPNEFWYFWRRFLADPRRDVWSDKELRQSMDTRTMLAELAGMMQVFQKPFAAKGMLFNYNIPFLDEIFDKVLFVQITRDPVSNVASVLDARQRQLGGQEFWYSFRIPEYARLKGLDPIQQVAGQVLAIQKAVTQGLHKVDESRRILVSYEEFCRSPGQVFKSLVDTLGLRADYLGPDSFQESRAVHDRQAKDIRAALRNQGWDQAD